MRFFILFFGASLCLAQPAFSQANLPASKPAAHIVSILSDGTSDPNGAVSQVLSEIAITLDKESDVRVLSLSGYGGATNARDLLQLRGADMAVINNDVLAYLDLSQTLPEVRRKVRLVAPLFNQRVLLFARQNVKVIEELKGRKVGVPAARTSRGMTARTVFGSMKIGVEVVELDNKALVNRADLDAILVFESDLPDLKSGISAGAYHLLSIPASNGPLAQVYLPSKLGKAPIAGVSSGQAAETIQVSTLLATFDWNAKHARYVDVVAFVEKFFAFLPQIRKNYPSSLLARTDLRMVPPGWQRFAPAEPLAVSAQGAPVKEPLQAPIRSAEPRAAAARQSVRLLALSHPPLTDAHQNDGGVALKLLTKALETAGMDVSVQWADGEKAFLEGLLADKADAGVYWLTSNCDAPSDQSASEAVVCDRMAFSEPIMRAVIGVFTRIDTPLGAQEGQVRTLCTPESHPVPEQARDAIPWLKGAQVKTLRMKTVIDCIAALDRQETDALITLEPEGRFVIEKLKLSQSLQLTQKIAAPAGLHALVAKDNPEQANLLQTINKALADLRASNGFAEVMAAHMADLTGAAAPTP